MALLEPENETREPTAAVRFLRSPVGNPMGNLPEADRAHVVSGQPSVLEDLKLLQDLGVTALDLDGIALPEGSTGADWFVEVDDPRAAVTRSDETPGGQDWHSETTYGRLDQRLAGFGAFARAVSMLTTPTGVDFNFPVLDDVSEEGEWLDNQGDAATQGDITGARSVKMPTQIISSKPYDVSLALLTDTTAFNAEATFRAIGARRIGRGVAKALLTGDGANDKPRGAVGDCAIGVTSASATAITAAEFLELIEKVNIAYLGGGEGGPMGLTTDGMNGNAYVMHQNTKGILRRTFGTDGHPVYLPSLAAGEPDTLDGYRIIVDNAMPMPVTNQDSVLFGNIGYYLHRMVRFRVFARLWDSGVAGGYKVRFIAFERHGGRAIGGFSAGNVTEAWTKLHMA